MATANLGRIADAYGGMVEDRDLLGALLLPIPLAVGGFVSFAASSVMLDFLAGDPFVDNISDAVLGTVLQLSVAYLLGIAGFAIGGGVGKALMLMSLGALVLGGVLTRAGVDNAVPTASSEAVGAVESVGESSIKAVEEKAPDALKPKSQQKRATTYR